MLKKLIIYSNSLYPLQVAWERFTPTSITVKRYSVGLLTIEPETKTVRFFCS